MTEDKRRAPRMVVNLPAQARLGETRVANLSVTDISSTGMQIQSPDFDTLKNGFNTAHNEAFFELHIDARMAWLQNDGGHSFLTGWEFVFTSPATQTTQGLEREEKNKRRHDRLTLELTIQGHVGGRPWKTCSWSTSVHRVRSSGVETLRPSRPAWIPGATGQTLPCFLRRVWRGFTLQRTAIL